MPEMYALAGFALVVVVAICIVFGIVVAKLLKLVKDQSGMLASRNYTEYSVSQARMAKAVTEQKPEPSYGDAWTEDKTHGDQS